jgi:hypothetical protein
VHFPWVESRFRMFGLFLSWDVLMCMWNLLFHPKLSDLTYSSQSKMRMFGFLTLNIVLSGSVALEKILVSTPDK